MYTLSEIAGITGSEFVGKSNHQVGHFFNDSRSLQPAEDSMFIALKTKRNDGHLYIRALAARGQRSFMISRGGFDPRELDEQGASFVICDDPLRALQKLAAHHRRRFNLPVIGITGSNGKTVVKEWLYQCLKHNFTICRSPKSYNSQIGVPLSVLNLNVSHTLAIFEAGISQPGEMEILADIIQPTIGVFTSIGSAHDEGFDGRGQKISEKLRLFSGTERTVINGLEQKQIPAALLGRSVTISDTSDADCVFTADNGRLQVKTATRLMELRIPFSDKASSMNAVTCAVVMMQLGLGDDFIVQKLGALQPVALRLEIKNGIHNSLIINDYYNSDLDSIKIGLNYLQQQNRRIKKIVVISDIEQSGINASNLYRQLAELFSFNRIDLVIGIGREIANHRALFKAGSLFYNDTATFISQFRLINFQFSDATILLKGARSFGFEEISRLLQLKSHDTVFEVNLNRLTDNVNYYRSLLAPGVKLMCMVKAMGYGSGGAEIARTLQHIGANYLAVAYADEGVELRQSQVTLPIMVMSPEEDAFSDIVTYDLEPEIYSFKVLFDFVKQLDAMGIAEPYPVHLKIDTGMHRLGFEEKDLELLVQTLKNNPQLKVRSVFSHLAASDNPEFDSFTAEQIRLFEKAFTLIEDAIGYKVIKHICNSAGISRFKNSHYDMVRLGIGMYGIGVDGKEQAKLENVGTLKTRISQVKNVRPGDSVSYNRSGRIGQDTRVATIPIGYADGFSRLLGNGRHGVYINGAFCKTIGNICMDMTMIDVSGTDCMEGDEVIIFENSVQISAMATALNSIAYEVLTSVSARVKRIYVQE